MGGHVGRAARASRADQVRLQVGRGRGEADIGDLARQLDGLVLDGTVGQHGDHGGVTAGRARRPAPSGRRPISARGPTTTRRVVGDLREQVGGLVEQLLQPTVGGVEEVADPLLGAGVEATGRGHVVDEEAVALVGGNAAGRRVRLGEVALLLEHGHLVAHGGRADLHAGRVGDVGGPHRLRGGDVLLHHGPQDGGLAFVEHRSPSGRSAEGGWALAVQAIDCQR